MSFRAATRSAAANSSSGSDHLVQVAYNKALKAVEVYAQLPPNSSGSSPAAGSNGTGTDKKA